MNENKAVGWLKICYALNTRRTMTFEGGVDIRIHHGTIRKCRGNKTIRIIEKTIGLHRKTTSSINICPHGQLVTKRYTPTARAQGPTTLNKLIWKEFVVVQIDDTVLLASNRHNATATETTTDGDIRVRIHVMPDDWSLLVTGCDWLNIINAWMGVLVSSKEI